MKTRFLACGLLLGAMVPLLGQEGDSADKVSPLERLIGAKSIWETSLEQFAKDYQTLGFLWTSSAKESVRADGRQVPLEAFGKKVGETIVQFEAGVPKLLQFSFYNRGDDGEILEAQYEGLLQFWGSKLDEVTGVPGERRGKDNKNAVRAEGVIWSTESNVYLLEYSAQRRPFRAEFIRLRVARIIKKGILEEKLAKEDRTVRADLPSNVVRKDGAVMVGGIPMVDQGEKGYCVVATAARVFRYYGMQVDQHEIAQMADSSAATGTSSGGMLGALNQLTGRLKVRTKTHYQLDIMAVKDLVEDYNRLGKREGKKALPDDPYASNLWENFDQFDGALLKEARMKDKSGFKRFKSEIQNSVDLGVPLLWMLHVGLYPEGKLGPQSRGGHTRLIIGYDWGKDQVIYSDSWGAGHEAKRFGAEEAFCATTGLYSVLPIK